MKKQLKGIQISYEESEVIYIWDVEEMTVDCHLGSLIITKDELLDYLEKRTEGKK
jgi:predicted DNA-binding protein (UPF0251 family)